MDGFIRHRIEGVSVDIEVIPAARQGFAARFRILGDGVNEPDWHAIRLAQGPFATRRQAEEAAKSAALSQIISHGLPRH
ncbi:MAG TPA: hypothetical protein VL598_12460 [Trinickia sp.]|jgi:hypothetical protein|uniref:hypothetical protein n=1 Tax=Trinickia sp. TaxID=2571163 RepID=UPI002B5F9FD5|nr:hypothetical protein [Trinickia sp.]HTI18469.1 hypothetical protein [Trinickia sp.]